MSMNADIVRLSDVCQRRRATVYRLPSTVYRLPSTVYRLPSTVYRLPSTPLPPHPRRPPRQVHGQRNIQAPRGVHGDEVDAVGPALAGERVAEVGQFLQVLLAERLGV